MYPNVEPVDPLSDVLSLLKPRSLMSGGWDVGGDWSVRFPRHEGIKCYALVSGQCWLSMEGIAEPLRVVAGDCFLLPHGRPFCLASDLNLAPVDAYKFFQLPMNGAIRTVNGGGDCFGVGGIFTLAGNHADILLGALPPIVHIRKESDKAAIRWSLERMMEELREPQPGSVLVARQLAYMMLVQALRLYLAEGLRGGVGWLFALADKHMSVAIGAMHGAPAHDWTIQKLAERAGMSRSTFALKFKQTVGESPMEYLTRWRMMLAGDKVANSSDSISSIARSLGYESESAFSTAFKRVMGCSPRQYGRVGGKPDSGSPSSHPADLGKGEQTGALEVAVG
jgi:AraC-like DNA-binding protein